MSRDTPQQRARDKPHDVNLQRTLRTQIRRHTRTFPRRGDLHNIRPRITNTRSFVSWNKFSLYIMIPIRHSDSALGDDYNWTAQQLSWVLLKWDWWMKAKRQRRILSPKKRKSKYRRIASRAALLANIKSSTNQTYLNVLYIQSQPQQSTVRFKQ